MTMIYKICDREMWQQACSAGIFRGAPIDLQDGYIHFSTAVQVQETAARHFAGQTDLLLIQFDDSLFGDRLKWEPSRGGDLFPHLYDTFSPEIAAAVWELPPGHDGQHVFPEAVTGLSPQSGSDESQHGHTE